MNDTHLNAEQHTGAAQNNMDAAENISGKMDENTVETDLNQVEGIESAAVKTEEVAESQDDITILNMQLEEWKDKYLRLASEFDNFRKRTQKEKTDLIRYANEDLLRSVLPVLDDFDRSLLVMEKSDNVSAIREGMVLVSQKFKNILLSKGLKPMESLNTVFDSEIHEAITSIPAVDEAQKGKVVDEVEKGYYLDEKVIRFAKVIVGA